jgi:membrane protease YdiL (CAAX protease family)
LIWNHEEGRIRSGIRLGLQSLLFLLLAFGVVFVMGDFIFPLIPEGADLLQLQIRENYLFAELTSPLVPLIAALLSLWVAGRYLDKRKFADYGFHFSKLWFADMGFGLLLGAFLMGLIFLFELEMGWLSVTGFNQSHSESVPFWIAFVVDFVVYLSIGIYEELLFRGYHLRNLAEGFNHKRIGSQGALSIALILSSILFGILHGGNPNANWISTANIIIAGLFLASGFIMTGELAIPIGLHISWNFFQGAVFGFPVSGISSASSVFGISQTGPQLITGGSFGPEAGLVGLISMGMGFVAILFWVNRDKKSSLLEIRLAEYTRASMMSKKNIILDSSN